MKKLLSSAEVAEILGVKEKTLRDWRATKRYDLPYVKSGWLVKYRAEDVEAFIESRKVGGEDEAYA